MSAPIASAPLPGDVSLEVLLPNLLDVSLTGIQLLRPVYAPDGSAIIDFAFSYTNPAGLRISGVSEPLSGTLLEVFPHTRAAGVLDYYQRAFAATEPLLYEVNYQADRIDNYLEFSAQRSGEYLLVSFTDTRDQTRSAVEVALRASQAAEQAALAEAERQQALLYRVFEQAPAIICILQGPQHVFEFANTRYRGLMGERPLVGRPFAEALPELVGQGILEPLNQVYRTGEAFFASEQPARLDYDNTNPAELEQRYYNLVWQARRDLAGVIDGVLVFAFDVTPQVLARQQVQALNEELATLNEELTATNEEYLLANTALVETQQQLRQLNQELEARVQARTHELEVARAATERQRRQWEEVFRRAPAAICLLDGPELVYQFVNPPYQALFPGRKLLGKPLAEALPELRGQPELARMRHVYDTGEVMEVREALVPLARTTGGPVEDIYFDIFNQARYHEAGHIDGIISYATDATAQVRARQLVQDLNQELAAINEDVKSTNEELSTTNRQLTRTNVDLDTFVYTASHDLKAPITNIEGLLTALRYELPAEVQAEETTSQLLDLMQGAVERFQYTITQLTDVSRLQHAQNQPLEQVPLAAVVEDVRLDLLPLLTSTRAQLTVAVGPELVVLFAPKNLRSVVVNLLSNALKYHHPDRAPVVALRAVDQGSHVVLTVADNGLGLHAHQQERLFGLFQRLHTHVEGTGVGLYMVKRIVENMGGTITVQSEVGVGSTFTVTLPTGRPR